MALLHSVHDQSIHDNEYLKEMESDRVDVRAELLLAHGHVQNALTRALASPKPEYQALAGQVLSIREMIDALVRSTF